MRDYVEDQSCRAQLPIAPARVAGCGLSGAPGDHPLADLVQDYIERFRPRHDAGLAFYRSLPSLETAVEKAALAIRQGGGRQPHQRRLPAAVLRAVRDRLIARVGEVQGATAFAELLRIVEESSVPGFGRLAKYDAALRIGCWLRLLPERVYLHAGTKAGARALGLDTGDDSIGRNQLPPELDPLEMHEVEDFLCIYKGQLRPSPR